MNVYISHIITFFLRKVRRNTPLMIALAMIFLSSCTQKKFDSEEALWAYMKDEPNQFIQYKSVNGIDFSLTYRPTDLLVKQALSRNATEDEIDSLRSKYHQYLYFNLSISKNDQEVLNSMAGNRNQFGAMVNQLAFGMTENVHLYTPKRDTIAMLDYVYPRMYGMSTSTNMLLVYPRDAVAMQQEYINLSIEDIGLFTGEVTFKIPTSSINNEPRLNFKKASSGF